MANSVLRQTIHTSLAKTLLSEINTRSVKYYFSYGRTQQWGTVSETTPSALDTYPYEFQARKDTVFMQEVTPGDAALVIPRINWVSGSIYDYYDNYSSEYTSYTGAPSLEESLFYVITDDLNVYKCLDNNNNGASTVKPSTTSTLEFRTSDNYVWKYMYTIRPFLANKFLSTTQMPVANAVQQMYYSDGKLEKFVISSKGEGYLPNVTLDGTVSSHGGVGFNYRKLFGTNTAFETDFTQGDYFVVNGEVRRIASIESDTELTINADDPLLYVAIESTITKLNTYISIIDGDGFKAENPYIVTGITMTNQGTGYSSVLNETTVVLSDPQLPGSRRATAKVDEVVAGKITKIKIVDSGSGYTLAPTIVSINDIRISGNTGQNAAGTVNVIKSKAYLEPVISPTTGELVNIVPSYPGTGYTYANLSVIRVKSMELPAGKTAWTDAEINVDFNFGKLDTKQSNVELSAVNGCIHAIRLVRQGVGYAAGTTITVSGDGTGCTAEPVIEAGVLTNILVTNVGKDYTYASVTITPAAGTVPSVTATPRAVISPPGGHGKSAVDELFGRTLAMFNRLSSVKLQGMTLSDVEYRQLCLYRQPRIFGSQLLYNGSLATTVYKISVAIANGAPALSTIPLNTVLLIADKIPSTVTIRFRLIERTTNEMLIQSIDNNDEYLANSLIVIHPNGTDSYKVGSVTKPDVEKLSGDVIYIDNRSAFKPLVDQTVSVSSKFKF